MRRNQGLESFHVAELTGEALISFHSTAWELRLPIPETPERIVLCKAHPKKDQNSKYSFY